MVCKNALGEFYTAKVTHEVHMNIGLHTLPFRVTNRLSTQRSDTSLFVSIPYRLERGGGQQRQHKQFSQQTPMGRET